MHELFFWFQPEEELAQYDDDDIDEELEKVISNLEAEENGSDDTDR